MNKRIFAILICALMCVGLVGCSEMHAEDPQKQQESVELHSSIQREVDSPDWVKKLPAAEDATQLLVVAGMGMDKSTAYVSLHTKDEQGNWKQIVTTPAVIGKNGMCLDKDHTSDCEQTPIGTYNVVRPVGIAFSPGFKTPYTSASDSSYWTGETDPDGDIPFNTFVSILQYGELDKETSEHLYDLEYEDQYCISFDFNKEQQPGKGTKMFIKCFDSEKPYTNGSVEVPEDIMRILIQNVMSDCVILIDTMDNLGAEF